MGCCGRRGRSFKSASSRPSSSASSSRAITSSPAVSGGRNCSDTSCCCCSSYCCWASKRRRKAMGDISAPDPASSGRIMIVPAAAISNMLTSSSARCGTPPDKCATMTTTGSFYYRPTMGGPVVGADSLGKKGPLGGMVTIIDNSMATTLRKNGADPWSRVYPPPDPTVPLTRIATIRRHATGADRFDARELSPLRSTDSDRIGTFRRAGSVGPAMTLSRSRRHDDANSEALRYRFGETFERRSLRMSSPDRPLSPALSDNSGPRSSNLRPSWYPDDNPSEEYIYRPKLQLYCRTGFNIAIFSDGSVRGTREPFLPHAKLEVIILGHVSEMQFKSVETNLYLAMDKKGRLYGEENPAEEATVWVESLHGVYNCYLSRKYAHVGWYLAVQKNGKPKKAKKTWWGQKAIQFLPRPTSPI